MPSSSIAILLLLILLLDRHHFPFPSSPATSSAISFAAAGSSGDDDDAAAPSPGGGSSGASQYEVAKQFDKSVQNVAAGDPTSLWTQRSRRRPLPTNKFWQNFVLNTGSAPEYVHPYSIHSKGGGAIGISYPERLVTSKLVAQLHKDDLIVSAGRDAGGAAAARHAVAGYDDLGVTLSLLDGKIHVPLVRGSPYVTFLFAQPGIPTFASNASIANVSASSYDSSKHSIFLSNGQKWVVYSSSPITLQQRGGLASGDKSFQGVIRVALVGSAQAEAVLDSFSSRYPIGGRAVYAAASSPPSITYQFRAAGNGQLLMLSLPLHRSILSSGGGSQPQVSYASIDGDLQGIVGESWTLIPRSTTGGAIGWHAPRSLKNTAAVTAALQTDVAALRPISTSSTYFFGKAVARAARMAVIAEEAGLKDVAGKAAEFVERHLSPWFDGAASGNAIVYDDRWGGLISRQGAFDSGADFGLGVYNDHHYHWGYFVYAGAVLARLNPQWGERYRTNLYSLTADYMSLGSRAGGGAFFPRLRHFDPWVLHSWAGGLTEFLDGRNQESTSEAVNAYYAASLLGDAYGDSGLAALGSMVAVLEAHGAKSLWHVPAGGDGIYEREFVDANRITGVLWASKRDSNLWFSCGSGDGTECKVGIQVIPVTPATELLFDDPTYARQLYDWAAPSLSQDSWKAFAYAVQATYDPQSAAGNVEQLQSFDDGNSLSNMLWWVYTRQ